MPTIHSAQTAELNLLWGSLILEELSRLGVQHVCMAPGSRSTPLTLAAASQDKLQQHIHFDERGLGFFALGLAKASLSPVAIITTSGTAVANLYPAIIEAWLTHVPLIILSGDRPNELVGCGANQAIPQPGIFAHYAKQINLPTPSLDFPSQALLSELDQQISHLNTPLHINCMYREPLYSQVLQLEALYLTFADYLKPLTHWQQQTTKPYIDYKAVSVTSLPTNVELTVFTQAKGVIIAGTLNPNNSAQDIIALSKKLGWPILADAQSQLRQHPDVINYSDQLLLKPAAKALLEQAEHLLIFGGRLLSKRIISYIENQTWQAYWQVLQYKERLDPSHNGKQVWQTSISSFCQLNWPTPAQSSWANELDKQGQQLASLFQQQIDNGEFGEAQIIRAICQAQIENAKLFIGNSLPIRLFDMFSPQGKCVDLYTNRGASGIDGLLATASGVAKHTAAPTTLIIGDISALHDLNSLAIARQITTPFVIIIINNDGGNIFNLLPVPNEALRKDYYRLSHGIEFGYAAAMFNLAYFRVEADTEPQIALNDFNDIYTAALTRAEPCVIEVSVSQNQASEQISKLAQWITQS